MRTLAQAVKIVLGHEYFYVRDSNVFLSETEEEVSEDLLSQIIEVQQPTAYELAVIEKAEQLATIKAQFLVDSEAPVEVDGILYNGGNDSARDIQGAVTLAEHLGETTVLIAGYDNIAREMTFEEALNVAAQVGAAWRTVYFAMQAAKVALENEV